MKHRALSILLALTFLLSVFMFCTTALAATGTQDGVSAELTTDKADYAAGESMNVTLVVKNGNTRVNNIRTELVIPAGVTLTTGALVSDGVDLAPNAEAAYQYGLTVDVPEVPTTTTPPTTQAPTTAPDGDDDGPADTGNITLVIYGVVAIASMVGMVVLMGGKNIFKQRWFALVLCATLLLGVIGPVAASAAATEKTFEVTENVSIAGTSAKLKAIITYDLNDEVLHTEEVAFKKDGQFLWSKEVEMGYWLPSDISYNGQTTSKDGSYRPEVTPPYIDMLFGCTSNQTGQFVSGEFKTDIFNANAAQTALIGLTDDPASKAALELIDEDEWIITLIDGKLVVTGWYDNATVAATRALYALAASSADDVTLNLPMIGKMSYVDVDLPRVPFGNFRGGMDSDQGVVVLRWNEVVADDFDTYCDLLTAAGYKQYEYNTLDGFKKTKTLEFATYVKGDDAVIVQYLPVSLLDEDPATLTSAELKAQQAMFSPDGDSIRLILTSADTLGNNDANNTGWEDLGITPKMHAVNIFNRPADGNAIGQGQIFTLADGSFILVDGGHQVYDAEQVYRALKYLNERPDGKIVIAAWILTHDHRDHSGTIEEMAEKFASEITVEQIILNNDPDTFMWRHKNAPYGYSYGTYGVFDKIEQVADQFGEDCKVVVAHMGQNMKIRNAEVEILTVGAEDLYPVLTRNDNSRSMAFRVSYPALEDSGKSQSTLILGDVTLDNTYHTFFPLMIDELYGDIVQVAHHGLGGQTSRFYPMFKGVDVALWPTDLKTIDANGLMGGNNSYLQAFDPLNVICEDYIMTFNLPFDKENDEVMRTKVGTFKTETEDIEMDITLLPAFRFQGQWAAKQDVIVDYLKAYTADVLILPLVDQNTTTKYNKADLVNALYEALDYQYIYYAPVWGCEADANMETGDGTMGHVILSVYPILKAETGILVDGTPDANPEGRGYAHVLLDVEGLEVDLVATHFNDAGNWTKFAEIYEQWGKSTIIAGNTKIGGDVTKAPIDLRESAFASDVSILATEGITFEKAATDSRLSTAGDAYFVNQNMSAIYTVRAVIVQSLSAESMEITFHANGGTGTMDPITTRKSSLPLPECAFGAPEGKRFKGWAASQADADAGNVIRRLAMTGNTELYAVWTDVDSILISTAFSQFSETNESAREFFVEYYTQNIFDVIALNNVSPSIDLDKLTADIGFAHYYVAINSKGTERTVLISKFEISNAEAYEFNKTDASGNATSWDPMLYATMKVGDRYVDICIGQHHSMALRSFAANIVKAKYDPSHELIITGYNSAAQATFFDATNVSLNFIKGSMNSLYHSAGLGKVGYCGTDEGYVAPVSSMWTPSYAEFVIAKTYTVSFDANGGTGTMIADKGNPAGNYVLPENGFTAPNGAKFMGWALTPNGEVITSLDISGDVTLYARWAAETIKVMSWNVNLFGVSDAAADAIIAEVKAQNPDIVGLHNVGNQSWRSSNTSYTLDAILEKMDYPYAYYMPLGASYVFADSNFYGSLILSKYPLNNMTAAGDLLHGANYVGHCVADLGTAQVDLYIARELKAANRGDLYNLIQSNTTAGNDFILFAAGGVAADATIAGKPVAVATYDSNIAVVASTVNQSVAAEDMWKVTKPAAISGNTNANLIVGNEALMKITLKKTCTVSFDANGGTGTMDAAATLAGEYTLPQCGFTAPEGGHFLGWALTPNGDVITTLEVTDDVTLYARWAASSIKVMSWNVNLFGVSDAAADAIIAEVKAQNPDIVGLHNVGNQSWRSSNTSYTLDAILEKMDYPYAYYMPLGASYVFADSNFYGSLILSKYPLNNMTAAGDLLHGANYVGHCVADLGTAQVDLYIARELKAANRGDLYNLIQSNTTAGNDFILFAAGGVAADATIAGKPVAVATYDSNIAVVASTVNQSVAAEDMWKVTKPAAISGNTNANLIVGNEALMKITLQKEYTVSFDANGGTGTMDAVSVQVGDYTLPANGFTAPNGGRFLGWALSRDGEVITSLELTGNVTLYARWAADSVTVMSWNVNLFGTNDKCADAVIAEIKAQNPAIAGLINTSNQSWRNSHISYNLEKILAELDYPFYYYVPTSAKHVFGDDNFSGSLILSKYPLTDMVTSDYKTYDGGVTVGNYIGHCVVDLGTKKVDLFTGREAENAATRTALYNAIQETVTEGNDFILFVQGAGIIAEETVAGKPVAVAVYDGVAVVASTVNQRAADMWMVNKPEVIANDNNGKLIISNEVFMTIQIAEEYTVSFNANGGTGTMDAVTATAGSYTLPANGFTAPAGKRFIGWSLTADDEVITSLELTGDVTLYARWGAETLKVMSWSVNLFGVNNDCADIIINEVKAQDPDIVGLANVGNQAWGSNGRITYTLDEILEKLDYPYYYYVPLGANYVYSDTNFYGHLILSKYPLTNMVTENYGLMGANYIGHCVADVGTAKLDLFITYDVKMAVRAELFSYIQANTAPGNDFILMAHGGIPSDATIAGKPVAVASYDSNIGIVASVEHQGVGENDCWKQAKPTALASYKGNALIGNEALMRITIK